MNMRPSLLLASLGMASLALCLTACGDDAGSSSGSGGNGGSGGAGATTGQGGSGGAGATTGQGGNAATSGQGGNAATTPESTCDALCGKLVECGAFDTKDACTPGCTMAAADCSEADLTTAAACVSETCDMFPPCFEAVTCIKS
jgi:hypothetical protein